MTRSPRWAWLLLLVTAAAVAGAVEYGRRGAAREAFALATARRENLELLRLRDENRHLEAARLTSAERSRLEAGRFEAKAARARLLELQHSIGADGGDSDPGASHAPVPVEAWSYAGRESPRAALKSVLWAASHADVDALAGLIGFSPEVRKVAEALYAQLPADSKQEYASPERVVATLIAGNFPKDASAMSLENEKNFAAATVVVMRLDRSDGTSRTNWFLLQPAQDGWRLMVPPSVMADYQRILTGGAPSPDSPAP
jgi:hypothetical protein